MRPTRRPARAITISLAGGCVGLIAFVHAPVLAAGLVLLFLASLALTTAQVHIVTRVQQVTPDQLRGAISGLSAISQSGLAGVAAAGMAMVAGNLGASSTITGVAAVSGVAVVLSSVRARSRQTEPGSAKAADTPRAASTRL
jgi:predicted MFS family arabinose efflux permease